MTDLSRIRHVVLDMDGTIYLGDTLFSATRPFLALLSQLGIGCTFITNNCSHSRSGYVQILRTMGIDVDAEAISTSAQATAHYLQLSLPHVRRLFVLGTAGFQDDLKGAGFEVVTDRPDAVVVGFDPDLTYDQLARTAYWISQPLPYIATHPDRVCPTDKPIVLPDCGAICALLEVATGRRPDAVPGKPSPAMLQAILERHGLAPNETAMVGDRLYTDMRMARDAGAIAILTLTGETKRTQLDSCAASDRPVLVVADLEELGWLFQAARS
ncbi:MAG TPA: HAD-IIA family hydrolase [Lacipirellulaceae bacterium]|jgi:NagD protein|nr:HAD-IIA family hydrolase [Lacipirellulaceae bacterium]